MKVVKKFTHEGKDYNLELSCPYGDGGLSGATYYHVHINNYYQGRIFKKGGKWVPLDDFKPSSVHPFVFDEKWFNRMGELIEKAGDIS